MPGAVGACFALSDDGRSAVLPVRDGDGFLSSAVLNHQEQLLTRGMEELCGQVGLGHQCSQCSLGVAWCWFVGCQNALAHT